MNLKKEVNLLKEKDNLIKTNIKKFNESEYHTTNSDSENSQERPGECVVNKNIIYNNII